MEGMDKEAVQEALDHDEARKGNGGGEPAPEVTVQSAVPTADLVNALEVKQAYLAKSVSMAYVDASRACVGLALQQLQPVIDLSGNPKSSPKVDSKLIATLMAAGEQAVKIAGDLDVLGDKCLVRADVSAE